MAMRSKMTAKKKGKAKKSKLKLVLTKKKKPGRPRPLALVGDIGIISTIDLPDGWRKAFKDGLNNDGVAIKVRRRETYKKAKLQRAIEFFNNNANVVLIVTVGGLVVSDVANTTATKPFLSLVGSIPASPSDKFFGGLTLQSYKSNPDRIAHLRTKGFAAEQIGLFYNPNSAMSGRETAEWTGARPPVACNVDANGDVDPTKYLDDLAKFPAAVKAIVISADPFFTETMNELVEAANNSGRQRICYPLQDYADAAPSPATGKTTLFGPALKSSYRHLGSLARTVLETGQKLDPFFLAVPDIVKDI
jgi:hypothetical protein